MSKDTKTKSSYPEIDEIREDLNSLRNNVVELTRHVKNDGTRQAQYVQGKAQENLENLAQNSREKYGQFEQQIKSYPGQSVALAFASGFIASLLLGRR